MPPFSGKMCTSPFTHETHESTRIMFQCSSEQNTLPEFVEKEGCTYIFIWSHKSACGVKSNPRVGKDCRITHPISGHTYNFNPINKVLELSEPDVKFKVGVCGQAKGCGSSESGSCIKDSNGMKNMGNWNKKLSLNSRGEPFLNYTGGDRCIKNPRERYSTLLMFR